MQLKKQLLTFAAILGLSFSAQAISPEGTDLFVTQMSQILNNYSELGNDEEYRQRLKELSGQIDYQLDPMVKDQITLRVEKMKSSTAKTLGRADIYFPIFEEYLAKYNVPYHIKYLSIIESNLQPRAKSPAGAGGLWQFIPSTARMYNMAINATTDERSDTHRASEAAAKLLSDLYKYHGDWALAMASYNCGAGRVNSAIRQAGSKDYWKVRKFLPYETQKYVPYFMAVVYAGEFAHLHDITLEKQHTDLLLTDTIHFNGSATFNQIAEDYNVHVDTVRFLNPAYLKNYMPKSSKTHIIVLPARAVAAVRGYEEQFKYVQTIQTENPIRAVRRVFTQDDLDAFAKAFRCSVKDILNWNGFTSSSQIKTGDLVAIRKFSTNKDFNYNNNRPTTKNNMIQTINLTTMQVTSLKNNKAVVAAAHTVEKVVLNNNLPNVNLNTTIASNNKTHNTTVVPNQTIVKIDQDRSRARNLRSLDENPTVNNPSSLVAVAKSTEVKSEPKITEKPIEIKIEKPIEIKTEKVVVKVDNSRNRARNLRTDQTVINAPIIETANIATQGKATPKSADDFIYHLVEPKQSLWDIKALYPHITSREILQMNKLRSENDIHVGLILKIPTKD
jgi:membrane-bound lytic murein transglycosylase D